MRLTVFISTCKSYYARCSYAYASRQLPSERVTHLLDASHLIDLISRSFTCDMNSTVTAGFLYVCTFPSSHSGTHRYLILQVACIKSQKISFTRSSLKVQDRPRTHASGRVCSPAACHLCCPKFASHGACPCSRARWRGRAFV